MAPLRGYGPVTSKHTAESNDVRLREFTSPEDITLDPVRKCLLFPLQTPAHSEPMLT